MRRTFFGVYGLILCLWFAISITFAQSSRVVAIGDIHGDFDAFVGILGQARLIDPAQRWSGGNATLVQTGDFLDRGPKARAVMDLLMALQKDAPKQGGKIIVLMFPETRAGWRARQANTRREGRTGAETPYLPSNLSVIIFQS